MPSVWAAALCAVSFAQTTGTLDVGVSTVRYDGFLASGAAAIGPGIRWERPNASLTAQGTYLRFESGNSSVQGTLTGSLFSAPLHRWRAQALGGIGGSTYAEFASFHHAIGEIRLHHLGDHGGSWIGASLGRASHGGPSRQVGGVTVATWTQSRGLQLFASATRASVGDTVYSDLEVAARSNQGAVVLEGYAGARVWSRGGGRGVYGEGSATFRLRSNLALVLSGGRYPTDPVRGTISGRYASVALRLHSPTALRPPPPPLRDLGGVGSTSGTESSATTISDSGGPDARVEVLSQGDRAVRFLIRAPAAGVVEIAGDFTDWKPVPLDRGATGMWEVVVRISSGIHRIAVRVDGGPWIAPAGSRRAEDDFGGEVGILVVP